MKHYRIFRVGCLVAVMALVISGCNYSGKITRRYKKISKDEIGCKITDYVTVDATYIEKESPSPAPVSLASLSERGQVAFMRALAAKEPTTAGFLEKLRSELTLNVEKKTPDIIDYTRISKRLSINIDKKKFDYGARIDGIKIVIKVTDPNFYIRSCNRTMSEYMVIDQGKLAYSNTNSLEATANAGLTGSTTSTGGLSAKNTESIKDGDETLGSERTITNGISNVGTTTQGINGKFVASRTMNEEVQLKQRLVALSGFVKNNELHLLEEGISGIDLNGTISADIVAEYLNDVAVDKIYNFSGLFTPAGVAQPQGTPTVRENFIQYINVTNDISATITYEASYRKIDRRAKTISEADDHITQLTGKTGGAGCAATSFVLIPKEALRPKTWSLMYTPAAGGAALPLHIENAGVSGELVFNSLSNATEFVRWLKTQVSTPGFSLSNAVTVGGHKLVRSGRTVPTVAEINSIVIRVN